jgi:hypothetical protein
MQRAASTQGIPMPDPAIYYRGTRHDKTTETFEFSKVAESPEAFIGIIKPILDEFRRIRPKDVVWSRGSQLWRKRRDFDKGDGVMVS